MRTPAMRRFPDSSRLVLLSFLVAASGGLACSGWHPPWAKPPALVEQAWAAQTVLVEPGAGNLGTPSVFFDAAGRPAVALADRAFYMGTQTVALARLGDDGWRVELPLAPAHWRVCGRAGEGDAVVLTYGSLDGPLDASAWDGASTSAAEPGPCPRPSSSEREASNAAGTHQLELSRDARTLWHAAPRDPCPALDAAPGQRIGAFNFNLDDAGHVVVGFFEHPEADAKAAGRLLQATCDAKTWSSSVVAQGVRVSEVGVALDGIGRPHVAYVLDEGASQRLVYAVPAGAEPAPASPERDARVEPAVAACLRVQGEPPRGTGVEIYQQGDALRCAVLQRDPTTSQQALAVADERCTAGQASACTLAGALHHWLMGDVSVVLELPTDETTRFQSEWRGLRAEGVPQDASEASRRYARACELGQARACLYHAALLPAGDPLRRERATAACDAGLAHGCALMVATSGLHPDEPTLARAEPVLRTACEADDAAACNDLGVVLHHRGDVAGARAAFVPACQAKLEPACHNLERP